jgi:glycosyltransferase involved in cell wall biosynthesis
MQPTLLIYIPTYNGSQRIETSLKGVLIAIENLPEKLKDNVIVHVADDFSTDNTLQILHEIKQNSNVNLNITKNQVNVGMHENIFKGIELDYNQELTMVIGDDDILAPNALLRLFDLLDQLNTKHFITQIDLLHLNYCAIDIETFNKPNIFDLIKNNKINGWLSNKKHTQPTLCKLYDLIDPQIEAASLGSTMNFIFNSKKVRNKLKDIKINLTNNIEITTALGACPLAYILIHTFNSETICLADPIIYTYASVGHQTWTPMRDKFLAIGLAKFLFECFDIRLIRSEHFYFALHGQIKICKKEYKNVYFSSEFEKLDTRYKDTILKTLIWGNTENYNPNDMKK